MTTPSILSVRLPTDIAPPIVISDEGGRLLARRAVAEALTLHLFANDHVPQSGDDAASYEDVRAPGYEPALLDPQRWEEVIEAAEPTIEYPAVTFSLNGSSPVYGYFVLAAGTLVWAQRFPAEAGEVPIPVRVFGADIVVVPRFTLRVGRP